MNAEQVRVSFLFMTVTCLANPMSSTAWLPGRCRAVSGVHGHYLSVLLCCWAVHQWSHRRQVSWGRVAGRQGGWQAVWLAGRVACT